MHRQRAEQQRRTRRTGRHVPQPHRADQTAIRTVRGKGQAISRQTTFAQTLGGLGEARGAAEGEVEQRLALGDVGARSRG